MICDSRRSDGEVGARLGAAAHAGRHPGCCLKWPAVVRALPQERRGQRAPRRRRCAFLAHVEVCSPPLCYMSRAQGASSRSRSRPPRHTSRPAAVLLQHLQPGARCRHMQHWSNTANGNFEKQHTATVHVQRRGQSPPLPPLLPSLKASRSLHQRITASAGHELW